MNNIIVFNFQKNVSTGFGLIVIKTSTDVA